MTRLAKEIAEFAIGNTYIGGIYISINNPGNNFFGLLLQQLGVDLLNAVRLDLHADCTLGGLALDLTSIEAARDHVVEGDEVIDVIEFTILVAYVKNPVTGL